LEVDQYGISRSRPIAPRASSLFRMERIKSSELCAVNHWMWLANSEVADTGPVNSMVPTISHPIRRGTFTLQKLMRGSASRSSSISDETSDHMKRGGCIIAHL